jgi:radical SAM family uncharacterized protein/radical SAM-linked protein
MINIEKLLPLVQRPSRYIDHEWNAHPPKKAEMTLCLCFPDLYEVGASNLGLEILYHTVNRRTDAVAERSFAPADDMEQIMRKEKIPLFSLESRTPLNAFDLVGFSLQYELCATNVLNMLDLAGIPLFARDRQALFPLVIGGGPVTANPEPMADFFDAFVLGDGEEALQDIIEVLKKAKGTVKDRRELLRALAEIPGVYVPFLYAVEYNADGTLQTIRPDAGVPAKVIKRTVKLDEAFFPHEKIVPYLQTVHNRLNIELARGCAGQCRFCQAAKYYWPWRLRPYEQVLSLATDGLAATGYEEIAFSSLSCTDYKDLDKLLTEFNRRHGAKRINISLPSIRCDQFSLQVADNLGYGKRPTLTFAPEAGTDRLRNVIAKNLPENQILETLSLARQMGWRLVKLYFMLGLPTETEEDVEGINTLVRTARRQANGLNFTVTLSPFVPKAQTPFQWHPMANPAVLRSRLQHLSKVLPASVKGHALDSSLLEGVLARGDRRLSAAIHSAWRKGCRFDQWNEQMRNEVWQEAFRETAVDTAFYLHRERGEDEILPWDHLEFGAAKQKLLAEYRASRAVGTEAVITAPVSERRVFTPPPAHVPAVVQTVQRLRLRFARHGVLRFLSHLEQIEVFRRAFRRADLPLAHTAGFSPQPKIAFGPAISVGYESESEYVEIELTRRLEPEELKLKIAKVFPAGFTLLSVRKVPLLFPSLDSLVNIADYFVGLEVASGMIDGLLAQAEIIIEKRKEGKMTRIDARPLIRELKAVNGGLFLSLRFGPKRNVKPEKILQVLCGLDEQQVKLVPITRTTLLIEKKDGTVSEP